MFGIKCSCGTVITNDTLEGILASKEAVLVDGKQCTQVQHRSTLEALLEHLNEGK